MPDNDSEPQEVGPPCYKCRSKTRYRTRIADPKSSRTYDLYECTDCGDLTWAPVDTK